jgi:hypothetical protein
MSGIPPSFEGVGKSLASPGEGRGPAFAAIGISPGVTIVAPASAAPVSLRNSLREYRVAAGTSPFQ